MRILFWSNFISATKHSASHKVGVQHKIAKQISKLHIGAVWNHEGEWVSWVVYVGKE